jgi:hypothetical protein
MRSSWRSLRFTTAHGLPCLRPWRNSRATWDQGRSFYFSPVTAHGLAVTMAPAEGACTVGWDGMGWDGRREVVCPSAEAKRISVMQLIQPPALARMPRTMPQSPSAEIIPYYPILSKPSAVRQPSPTVWHFDLTDLPCK